MITVKSSLIQGIDYDEERKVLIIEMKKGGGKYEYGMVMPAVWEEFRGAKSLGEFFVKNIRGKFPIVNFVRKQ